VGGDADARIGADRDVVVASDQIARGSSERAVVGDGTVARAHRDVARARDAGTVAAQNACDAAADSGVLPAADERASRDADRNGTGIAGGRTGAGALTDGNRTAADGYRLRSERECAVPFRLAFESQRNGGGPRRDHIRTDGNGALGGGTRSRSSAAANVDGVDPGRDRLETDRDG